MRCPTCGAVQDWTETCRRCKSDLDLLSRVVRSAEAARDLALTHLRAGRYHRALRLAQQAALLSRDAAAERLLAVCFLLCGQPELALRQAAALIPAAAEDAGPNPADFAKEDSDDPTWQ